MCPDFQLENDHIKRLFSRRLNPQSLRVFMIKIQNSERQQSPAHLLAFFSLSVRLRLTLAGEGGMNKSVPFSPPVVLRVAGAVPSPLVLNSHPALELQRRSHRCKAPASPLTSFGVLPRSFFFFFPPPPPPSAAIRESQKEGRGDSVHPCAVL